MENRHATDMTARSVPFVGVVQFTRVEQNSEDLSVINLYLQIATFFL
jgi:hypothetical protein